MRDIVISRKDVQWEIGLSIKHNHFAVKHSRLAKSLDFGQKWFAMPCSEMYWNEVKPIFDYLDGEKSNKRNWSDLPNKEDDVYIPLLNAFMNEIKRSNKQNKEVPKRMVEYLLGEFDFYKVISIDSHRITQIQTYNLHGKLNRASVVAKPKSQCLLRVCLRALSVWISSRTAQTPLNCIWTAAGSSVSESTMPLRKWKQV